MVERRDALVRRLRSVVGVPPAMVSIGGAPGMGKSWLVSQVLPSSGVVVVLGCRGLPAGPHVVTREVVAGLVEAGADRDAAGRALALIGAGDEHAVCVAVRALLAAAPTVVVVEDVDDADIQSRQVLRYLATRPPAGLVLLITHRPGSPLGGRLESAARGVVCRVELGPLDVAEVAGLAAEGCAEASGPVNGRAEPAGSAVAGRAEVAGAGAADGWAEQVHRLTGGIALLAKEVLALGDPAQVVAGRAIPPSVVELAQELLAGLGSTARRVVATAALLRGPTTGRLLARMCGLTWVKAEPALREAVEAGVMIRRDGGVVEIHPPLLAMAVARCAGDGDGGDYGDRSRAHAAIAQVLAGEGDAVLAELVHHCRAAGDLDAAARHADRMADRGDPVEAVRSLQELLGDSALPDQARAALAGRLGRLALTSLAYDDTVTLLRGILADDRLPTGLRGELRLSLALVLGNQAGDGASGWAELIRAVGELRRRPALAARAMSALALPYWGRVGIDEHLWWLEQAEQTVPERGDPALLTAVAVNRASVLMMVGDPRAWEVAAALPDDGSTAGEREQLVRGYSNLADGATSLGHHPAAADFLARAGKLARGTGPSYPWQLAEATELRLAFATGRWSGLAERARRYLDGAAHTPYTAVDAALVLAQLAFAGGEWDEAAEFAGSPGLQTSSGRCGPEVTGSAAIRIRLALVRDRVAHALAELSDALDLVRDKGGWLWSAELVDAAVEALLRAGEHDRAHRLVEEFGADVRGRDSPLCHALLEHCRATIVAADGRDEQAAVMFTDAGVRLAALPRPYERARAMESAGRCGLPADPVASLDLVARAAEVFTGLGATWDAARCGHLLRAHGGTAGARRGRRGYGRELSPREVEVAHLMSLGRTNKQIAQVLFLSPRTVERHVASVLRKVGGTRHQVRDPD